MYHKTKYVNSTSPNLANKIDVWYKSSMFNTQTLNVIIMISY